MASRPAAADNRSDRTGLLGRATPASLLAHPARTGLSLLLLLTAAVLLSQGLQRRFPFGSAGYAPSFYSILVHVLVVSYLPAAYLALASGANRRLEQLRPNLATAPGADWMGAPPVSSATRRWLVAGLLGASLGVIGPYLTEPLHHTLLDFWDPRTWSPEVVWHRVLGLVAGTWLGWFTYAVLRRSRIFARAARELPVLDLLDLQPLRPFTQQGLSNGLLAAGMLSIVGLLGIGPGINPMQLLLVGGSVGVVGSALLLPLRGVHGRIRAAKRQELAWCGQAIERETRRVREDAGQPGSGQLSDLVAYRSLIEQVREWPIDTPALRRMVLYLLIPLGSWVASALVQYLVEEAIPRL
jgi:hypothetical protein